MSLYCWARNKFRYELDVKGIVVALVYLFVVVVFSVNRDDRPMGERKQSPTSFVQVQPTSLIETSQALRPLHGYAQPSSTADSSSLGSVDHSASSK